MNRIRWLIVLWIAGFDMCCAAHKKDLPSIDDVRQALIKYLEEKKLSGEEELVVNSPIEPMDLPVLKEPLPDIRFFRTKLGTHYFEYPHVETAVAVAAPATEKQVSATLSPVYTDSDAAFLRVFEGARAKSDEVKAALGAEIGGIFAGITYAGVLRAKRLVGDEFRAELWQDHLHWRSISVKFANGRVASVRLSRHDWSADLALYWQSEAFKYFIYKHTTPERLTGESKSVLLITEFEANEGVALEDFVTVGGHVLNQRQPWGGAAQKMNSKWIGADLKRLLPETLELPPESSTPPIERLIVVSFFDDQRWVTRFYDSNAPPEALRRIYEIVRAGAGTKPIGEK